jgi:hypothetical protein|tara:strand:- start:21662 stop:23872 length:2211 start_codon:yes stop_codon:yes gene_type:complete
MKKSTLIILISVLIAPFANAQKSKINLPINWNDSATVDLTVTDFGSNSSALAASPTASMNTVLKVEKSTGAQTWAGTTLSTPAGLDKKILFAAGSTLIKAIVYSPDSGIVVRLKAEDASNKQISVETDARTTVANSWDTLTFDFANEATGTAAINYANTYNMISMFFDFGTGGSGKIYYLDDVFFSGGGTPPPSKAQIDLPITWDDTANINYSVTDFGDNSSILTDSGSLKMVLTTIKPIGSKTWAGTTLGDGNGLKNKIPFALGKTIIKAIVYSPDSGTVIRMKTEDHTNDQISVETETITKIANGWDTLTFDFANPAAGTAIINFANTYDQISIFYDFGNQGTGKSYSLNDVFIENGGGTPPPKKDQIELPITWDDTAKIDYSVTDFGSNASIIAPSPTKAGNLVLKTVKPVGSQTWAGTSLSSSNGLKTKVPFATGMTIIKALVYSPDVGTIIRMKAEDHKNDQITVETEATTTVANAWDTLTFDFSSQAAGTNPLDFGKTYDKISVFYDFNGAGSGKEYYLDNVFMGTGGGTPPIPDTSNVTFQVDMNTFTGSFTTPEVNGLFNGWCGSCGAMTDVDGDNIWELTVAISGSQTEYKFAHDAWTGQETLDSSLSCIKQTGSNINRILSLAGDTTLPAVCWESCTTCFPEGVDDNSNANNFKVYPNPSNDFVNISGPRDISELVIMDVIGNVVYSINPNESDLNVSVSNFENGMYIISILDAKGNSSVERFVKQ